MSQIKRIYVGKRPGEDDVAGRCAIELKDFLGIAGLEGCRMLVRYDVEGLTEEGLEKALPVVFAPPQTNIFYLEEFPHNDYEFVLAVEPLPGQYDQRADFAAQCCQLIVGGERPLVACAIVWVMQGSLSSEDKEKIKAHLINPVECREASPARPDTLIQKAATPPDVAILAGFIHMDEAKLNALHADMGLAMDMADLLCCQNYFNNQEKRDPTVTELRILDTYWSDHCRHTTFLTKLNPITIDDPLILKTYNDYIKTREQNNAKKDICLMDMATLAARDLKRRGLLPALDESEEINACSIRMPITVDGVTVDYLIQFKNETHNHPTEIEPFGGASTCLGGAIRDPLAGRAYSYQAMRITGAADPRATLADTLPGKLPQRRITQTAAAGYSSYGNQIGLAAGHVAEYYHPGFAAKRMECGAVIAAVPQAHVKRETPLPGDVILLLGGATGRDGCGGATGSSKAHTMDSLTECGAEVQKGNPPEERKLQRLFRDPRVTRMIKRCNDFGAGGVSVAIGELCDGVLIDLDGVPKKYEGLDGTELAISESQERMAVVVAAEDADAMIAFAAAENLSATQVATVTADPRMKMVWRGQTVADLARSFLNTNGASRATGAYIANVENKKELLNSSVKNDLLTTLADLRNCSQKGLVEYFDSTIGAGSVLMPFGGKYQQTPGQAMAALVPVLEGVTDDATVMAAGYDPYLGEKSPFHAGFYAVVEALARVAATGACVKEAYLSLQEYFAKPGADPARWGVPAAAMLGAFAAQQAFGLAAIGGKDSMSGTFGQLDVPPTVIAFAVAPAKAAGVLKTEFWQAGHTICRLKARRGEDGLLDIEYLKKQYKAIYKASSIDAARAVGAGGLAAAVAVMTFGNRVGAVLEAWPDDAFDSLYGDLILVCKGEIPSEWAELDITPIGVTCEEAILKTPLFTYDIEDMVKSWSGTLEDIFPTKAVLPKTLPLNCTAKIITSQTKPQSKNAHPRVIIPTFPGTNCEYDSARVFEQAGAKPEILLIRNRTPQDIEESVAALACAINQSQIIFIPGGFSGGDEPDGSAKMIVSVFRNPAITDAVHELLNTRKGLMLGICNGFQALIKLGLVPYGFIKPVMEPDDPTLTYNAIGRHVSQMAYTKVCSTMSPWLARAELGQVDAVPVSHGEGRLAAREEDVKTWIKTGQIATQYVDLQGRPTYETAFNPNGSLHAIEGLTSPDGRVLGKMGHTERVGDMLYKNINAANNQKLFEAGVGYFA